MIFRRITLPSPSTPGKPVRQFDEDMVKAIDGMLSNLMAIFDKGVNINDNLDVSEISVTTDATPDTETGFSHSLKRIPSGYIVTQKDKAAHIYDGTSSWTDTTIYLRSDVASVTAILLVF